MNEITDLDVACFHRQGAVCLRQVIDENIRAKIDCGIEKVLKNPTSYGRVQSREGDPGFFFTDYHMWRKFPEFAEVAKSGPGGEIAARMTDSRQIRFFYDGLFVKEPGTHRASDWHQDQPYYNVDGHQICVIWIPLDPVDRETSLRFVEGSHLWGKWFQPVFFASERILAGADQRFDPMPDIDGHPDRYTVLSWDLEPGDCIVFHPLTIHGARGNPRADRRRRAISTTWLGDDTVFGERGDEVEPKIEGHPFKPGDRLDVDAIFPLVCRNSLAGGQAPGGTF